MLPSTIPKPLLPIAILSRAIFPQVHLRRGCMGHIYASPLIVGSAPLSNPRRLAPSIQSPPSIAENAGRHPLFSKPLPSITWACSTFLPLLCGERPMQEPTTQQRVIESVSPLPAPRWVANSCFYILDKQDEAWRKQSSRVRMPSWSDYARMDLEGRVLPLCLLPCMAISEGRE